HYLCQGGEHGIQREAGSGDPRRRGRRARRKPADEGFCLLRAISAALGLVTRAMPMTLPAPPPWAPALAQASPSAQISPCAAFAKRPACPAADLPITTRFR